MRRLALALALVLAGTVPAAADVLRFDWTAGSAWEAALFRRALDETGPGQRVEQAGRDNALELRRTGRGHRAWVRQSGEGHSASLTQKGARQSQVILQYGRGTSAEIVQAGRGGAGITLLWGFRGLSRR